MTAIRPAGAKILLVEDIEVFRGLLSGYVRMHFPSLMILEASDGVQALEIFRREIPEFCILDLGLPRLGGREVAKLMARHHRPPALLFLSGLIPAGEMEELRYPGIWMTVEKSQRMRELDSALRQLILRRLAPTRTIHKSVKKTSISELSEREETLASMVGQGIPLKEIAKLMGISIYTAQTHRKNIMRKLGLHSSTMLAKHAIQSGLVSSV